MMKRSPLTAVQQEDMNDVAAKLRLALFETHRRHPAYPEPARSADEEYIRVLANVLGAPHPVPTSARVDRTGVGTVGSRPVCARFAVGHGYNPKRDSTTEDSLFNLPFLAGKEVHYGSVEAELMAFLAGVVHAEFLKVRKCKIWDEWVKEDGTIGPLYPAQWRGIGSMRERRGVDQLGTAVELLRTDPASRRMVVDSWQVVDLPFMALSPCHFAFQFVVEDGTHFGEPCERVSIVVSQRSCDVFLGLPFNIASYSLLLAIVCRLTGRRPGYVYMNLGDAHVYSNHLPAIRKYIEQYKELTAKPVYVPGPDQPIWTYENVCEDRSLPNYRVLPDVEQFLAKLEARQNTLSAPLRSVALTEIGFGHRALNRNGEDAGWCSNQGETWFAYSRVETDTRLGEARPYMNVLPEFAAMVGPKIPAPVAV